MSHSLLKYKEKHSLVIASTEFEYKKFKKMAMATLVHSWTQQIWVYLQKKTNESNGNVWMELIDQTVLKIEDQNFWARFENQMFKKVLYIAFLLIRLFFLLQFQEFKLQADLSTSMHKTGEKKSRLDMNS